jgi:hypothetical protein
VVQEIQLPASLASGGRHTLAARDVSAGAPQKCRWSTISIWIS